MIAGAGRADEGCHQQGVGRKAPTGQLSAEPDEMFFSGMEWTKRGTVAIK